MSLIMTKLSKKGKTYTLIKNLKLRGPSLMIWRRAGENPEKNSKGL